MTDAISSFIVDSKDYFAGFDNDKNVVVGLKNVFEFTLSKTHPYNEVTQNCKDEVEAEEVFDRIFETQKEFGQHILKVSKRKK